MSAPFRLVSHSSTVPCLPPPPTARHGRSHSICHGRRSPVKRNNIRQAVPPTAHCPASTVCRPQSTVHRLLPTTHRPPPAICRPPSTVHRPPPTTHRPPSTAHRPPPDNPASPQACSSVATPQVCTQTMSEMSDHHAPQTDSERTVAVQRPARPEQPHASTHKRGPK